MPREKSVILRVLPSMQTCSITWFYYSYFWFFHLDWVVANSYSIASILSPSTMSIWLCFFLMRK